MKIKKFAVVFAMALMIFASSSQVFAEDGVVVFGDEFGDGGAGNVTPPTPPAETPPPSIVVTVPNNDNPAPPPDSAQLNRDIEDDDENFGDVLNFDDPDRNNQPTPPQVSPTPVVVEPIGDNNNQNPVTPIGDDNNPNNVTPVGDDNNPNNVTPVGGDNNFSNVNNPNADRENRRIMPPSKVNQKLDEQKMQKQKARFLKIAVDDTYIYYLDQQSISWKHLPYFANEYMVDAWIRMIERAEDTSGESDYYSAYLSEENDEIALAKEKGILYDPVDVEVLSHRRYFLEHYYLRPKTEQIQFLCELEVIGYPQNTISERKYDYKNWEYLVPGSIESTLYRAIIKVTGKSKATDRGHMTFIDMVDEYARIALN